MARTKVPERKIGAHTATSMSKALKLIHDGMSIRKASKECNLKYSTVRLYSARMKENTEEAVRLVPNYEINRVFTTQEEKELLKYIEYCAQLFYGLTAKDGRRVAYQMAKVNNKKMPQSWISSEMAGKEWLRAFRRRNPVISLKKPEACSLARATAFNKHNIDLFYQNLKSAMERHPCYADGTRVYNLDETSTTTVQKPCKVLARKGTNVSKVTSGERGTLVTTCLIVGATGHALPPVMVFPRKKFKQHMLHGAPNGTLGLAASSGWMNAEIFVNVMQHFIKCVSASKNNPALLIMDNHESHLSIEALDLAKSSGVTVLTLHPHTTAKVQPLDVGINGPFKCFYNAAVDSWLLRNPGQPVTIYNVAECVGSAFMKAMTPLNITKAFKKCGIFPYDDNIFTEEDFMPSSVTDRPAVENEQEKNDNMNATSVRDKEITSTLLNLPGPSAQDKEDNHLVDDVIRTNNNTPPREQSAKSPNVIEPSPRLEDVRLAIPSTSKVFISPREFMPPLKAKTRNLKKRRTPGKSMIATDTPEKAAIAEKKSKTPKAEAKKAKHNLFSDKSRKKIVKNRKIEEDSDNDEEDFVASGSSSGGEDFVGNIDDEDDMVIVDGNFLPLTRDPKEQEYVVVFFPLKKGPVYYVAKILEELNDNDDDSDFFVTFLRLKNGARQTFWKPTVQDTGGIMIKDVKFILPMPKIVGSSRRQATFKFDVEFDLTKLNLR